MPHFTRTVAWTLAPLMFFAMAMLYARSGPSYLMGDFRAFYCAGSAIAQRANPYLEEPLRTCENAATPPLEPRVLEGLALPAPLPPYALLAFAPLSLLPFPVAAMLYFASLLAAMSAAVVVFARLTGASSLTLNIVFAAITATVTYYVGQPMPFVFLALAAAALLLRDERFAAAGACATAAMIEPQVALPAVAAMLIAIPRSRAAITAALLLLAVASVFAVGLGGSFAYVRDVLPAHALANAYEWQFSLTSVLTSFGLSAPLAVHLGEAMFAAMSAIGILVAMRLRRVMHDPVPIVLIPPSFAVFGGVHVHFQQLAIAFPAIIYVLTAFPRVQMLAGSGLAMAMIPWNLMTGPLFAGIAPVLVGLFCMLTIGRRAGLVLSLSSAAICLSVLALAYLGVGPAQAHFVPHAYPPNALAEASWGDFSHAALMRPSLLMQWLRLPTLAGLGCGLAAIALSARG
jgi:hypothetical protein